MAIFKNTYHYFSAMDSRVIRNSLLSLPALGMLTAFLDRAETWQFRLKEVARSLKLSESEAKAILSELIEKGFAVERRDGYGVYYDVYAYPARPEPKSGGAGRRPEEQSPREPHGAAEPGPASGRPMTDEEREAALKKIRELFPVAARSHDLNRVIGGK
jgi:hypothetical protein